MGILGSNLVDMLRFVGRVGSTVASSAAASVAGVAGRSGAGVAVPVAHMSYKLKTHKGTQKRFKPKANGFRRRVAGKSHGMISKNRKILRRMGKDKWVSDADEVHLFKLLPNARVRRK